MSPSPTIVRTVPALRRAVDRLRARQATIALVPTMGPLHDGHMAVVARMARDLDLGVKVIGSKTVRERDGLAMSSRNVYLSGEQRVVAAVLYRAMKQSAARLQAGYDIQAAMASGAEMITEAGFELDYFEVRDADTLAPIASVKDGPMRILVAARLGTTRLIDNIAV